ncbi:hypothetical protein EVAR_14733_1 [Eumeta japonica]|uniref:Uncharacterized protein n=1 Tax=Eumeta variegata TaxID=151549 RepID=A0A4C1TWH8_EUMVA|nr:hypothetical protein EVAR_14733_1 [Eumeta japonica]
MDLATVTLEHRFIIGRRRSRPVINLCAGAAVAAMIEQKNIELSCVHEWHITESLSTVYARHPSSRNLYGHICTKTIAVLHGVIQVSWTARYQTLPGQSDLKVADGIIKLFTDFPRVPLISKQTKQTEAIYCVNDTKSAILLADSQVVDCYHKCCARGRPIIVEWERDARHSAGLSLVRNNAADSGQKIDLREWLNLVSRVTTGHVDVVSSKSPDSLCGRMTSTEGAQLRNLSHPDGPEPPGFNGDLRPWPGHQSNSWRPSDAVPSTRRSPLGDVSFPAVVGSGAMSSA